MVIPHSATVRPALRPKPPQQRNLQQERSHHSDQTVKYEPGQTQAKRKMASQIPALLEPYLSLPPEASQIVLTGILGASTNWLTLRYLYRLLRPATAATRLDRDSDAGGAGEDVKVMLVSFMRDHAFWKDGAGRLVCVFVSPSHASDNLFPHPKSHPHVREYDH
jgi:hypothetical protein